MHRHAQMTPVQWSSPVIHLVVALCLIAGSLAAPFLAPPTVSAQSSLLPLVQPIASVQIDSNRTGIEGICLIGCSVSNRANVIDSNTTNHATINLAIGLGVTGAIAVEDTATTYPAGTFAGFVIRDTGGLSVELVNSITIRTFNNSVLAETRSGGSLLKVSLLSGQRTVGFTTSQPFDEIQIVVGSLATVLTNVEVLYAVAGTPDTVAPTITSITSTTPNGTYGTGAVINVTVNLSEPVATGSTVTLTLDTGATVTASCPIGPCNTLSGSYIVVAGNSTPNLNISSVSGTLTDPAGNSTTNPTIPNGQNLADTTDIGINPVLADTISPTINSITTTTANGTYTIGDDITLTVNLSEQVITGSTLELTLNTGTTVTVTCVNSPCATLSGTYTVAPGNTVSDLTVTNAAGTLIDTAIPPNTTTGIDLNIPNGQNLGDSSDIVVNAIADTTSPDITSITSTADNGSYGIGAIIPIIVTLSEPVILGSNLNLTLNTGTVVPVTCVLVACDTLTGLYTVVAGTSVADLTVDSVSGSLTDAAIPPNTNTNPTITIGQNLGDSKNIEVNPVLPDLTPARVTAITSATPDDTYGVGAEIDVTVNLSEQVAAGSFLALTLTTGDIVMVTCANGPCSSLNGTYIVGPGDTASKLNVVLLAGSLTDLAGIPNLAPLIPDDENLADNATIVINTTVVDTTAPMISSITSTTDDGTYGTAAIINITVNLSEPVIGLSGLTLTLNTGATVSLSCLDLIGGCQTLVGGYVVGLTDTATDLTVTAVSGALQDVAGNLNNSPFLPSGQNLGDLKNIQISTTLPDTTQPSISSITSTTADGSYAVGAPINITVNLSERVTTGSTLVLSFNTGSTLELTCIGIVTGCDTLSGTYIVGAGENIGTLNVTGVTGILQDLAGNKATNPALPNGQNLGDLKSIEIDTTVADTTQPSISSIRSTTSDGTYGTGANINVTVYLSEPVGNQTNLTLTLNTGATVSTTCVDDPCTTLSGTYTVRAGDATAKLTIDSITGMLTDIAGNSVTDPGIPGGQNLSDFSNFVINTTISDTTAPTIISFTSATANGVYGVNDSINITVQLSEQVVSGSSMVLTLSTGDTVVLTCDNGPCSSLSGTYIIGPGDTASDLSVTNVTGTLVDAAGNSTTNLTIPTGQNLDDTSDLRIDTSDVDGDGTPDGSDLDNDNDGIADIIDSDDDNDGIADTMEGNGSVDTDSDGIADSLDSDSDNDTLPDQVEAVPDPASGASDDPGTPTQVTPVDTDTDGTADYLDLDSDNDTISDFIEGMSDMDNDGIRNYRDADSDNDGIADAEEGMGDSDDDGIPNYLDPITNPTATTYRLLLPIVKNAP